MRIFARTLSYLLVEWGLNLLYHVWLQVFVCWVWLLQ